MKQKERADSDTDTRPSSEFGQSELVISLTAALQGKSSAGKQKGPQRPLVSRKVVGCGGRTKPKNY